MRSKTTQLLLPAIILLVASTLAFAQSKSSDRQPTLPYCVVSTGQTQCYDNRNAIAPPKPGQPFDGQDAQFRGHPANYVVSADGLTVYDRNTALTWQSSPDTNRDGVLDRKDKLTWEQAQAWPAKLNAARFGGFSDWRLPTIKELYSLFDCRGTDPSGMSGNDTSKLTPFIDTKYFKFAWGQAGHGERIIDSQYASCTMDVNKSFMGDKLFGVNFADGRIKAYGLQMPGGTEKTFFVQCVRGNPRYGKNDFHNNADGTITDRATDLMWTKTDSGKGMNWQAALAWAQEKNAQQYLGHNDWRLPNVKELQSVVDYTRSPNTTHSAAIDPLFDCTPITNEGGQSDFPFYWTSTTHGSLRMNGSADYVAFGRASGWLSPPGRDGGGGPDGPVPSLRGFEPPDGPGGFGPPPDSDQGDNTTIYHFTDVHGRRSRSDPKTGDPARFPHGHGPQGDVIRIYNFVRLVRDAG